MMPGESIEVIGKRSDALAVGVDLERPADLLFCDIFGDSFFDFDPLPALADAFLALETYPLRREKKGKVAELDLRKELVEIRAFDTALEMTIRRGKPLEDQHGGIHLLG